MPDDDVHEMELRLLQHARDGDREARRALFERYREVAFRVAVRVVGHHDDALDVVQDSFIKAFDALASFQGDAAFKTWLMRIVNNRALDQIRSRRVRLAVSLDQGTDEARPASLPDHGEDRPLEQMDRRESAERIQMAMSRLPPAQQAVMALYVGGELTYGQIAEIVGVPVGTVMSRIFHARRQLHEMLPDLAGHDRSGSES